LHYDLLLTGGTVRDFASGSERRLDLAISGGKIAALEPTLRDASADRSLDVSGKLVLPGLIDFHTHVYWGGTPLGVDPDALAPMSGVTTWIDAGSAGAGNAEGLIRHIVERSQLTIKFFLHVSYIGLLPVGHTDLRFGELFDHRLADARACLREIENHREHIVGIKARLGHTSTGPNSMDSLRVARSLGDATGLPLMIHVSEPPPLLSDVLAHLREGDIVTHCFTPGMMGILDRHGEVLPAVWEARERGVLFDVAHGAGSFSFKVAEAALGQGFEPDIISSDLHAYNVDGPTFDLLTTAAKFQAMGMSFDEVLGRCTAVPARVLGDDRKGRIEVGADADILVARREPDPLVLGDAKGEIRHLEERLSVDATIARGKVLEPVSGTRQGKRKPGLAPVDPQLTRPAGR
jgi:dihydroorotase